VTGILFFGRLDHPRPETILAMLVALSIGVCAAWCAIAGTAPVRPRHREGDAVVAAVVVWAASTGLAMSLDVDDVAYEGPLLAMFSASLMVIVLGTG
jgi:hypothetical protein